MPETGKALRLRRLLDPRTGNAVMIPMDHGLSSGPLPGLANPAETVGQVVRGGATCVAVQKGLVETIAPALGRAGLVVHVSASTALNPVDPDDKRIIATAEECAALGADAVSIHVNIGSTTEARQLEDAGRVAGACRSLGSPLLAMMYPRGKDIRNPHDPDVVKHVARVGAELGADLVKTVYTGSPDTFREVVRGCPRPILVAGGPKTESDQAVLEMVRDAMLAGARGVSLGRNVFEHRSPEAMTRAIAAIVLEGKDVHEVVPRLRAAHA